jgi:hypothetical protein
VENVGEFWKSAWDHTGIIGKKGNDKVSIQEALWRSLMESDLPTPCRLFVGYLRPIDSNRLSSELLPNSTLPRIIGPQECSIAFQTRTRVGSRTGPRFNCCKRLSPVSVPHHRTDEILTEDVRYISL